MLLPLSYPTNEMRCFFVAICGRIRKTDEVIAALMSNSTVKAAASSLGLHENTVLGYLKDEAFMAAYVDVRRSVLSVAMARLQASVGQAVETLNTIMVDEESPSSSRVSAARCILEMSAKFVEHEEIIVRLEALEAIIEKRAVS